MLSVKQGSIKYHFLSLWYDSTRDWTPVSQTIGEHKLIFFTKLCNFHNLSFDEWYRLIFIVNVALKNNKILV